MPIDASIILGLKPPIIQDPVDRMTRQVELQGAQQAQQINALKLQQAQQAMAGQQRANQVIASMPRNADGTFDTGALLQNLASANIPLDQQENLAKSVDGVNGVLRSYHQSRVDHAADLANVILNAHKPNEPVNADSVHLAIAAAKSAGLASDQDEQQFVQLLGQGADPETVLKSVRDLGSKYAAAQAKLTEPTKLGAGESLVIPATGEVVAANAPKPTGAEDDAKYESILQSRALGKSVSAEDAAFVKAYEQRKLLGPEATAAAAADRQAATIAQQIGQQRRAQDFTEQQAGRSEYQKNVATPYQTALTSAQELRDFVAAAQAGNKEAANLQSLQATMSTIRSNGLNRINTTELGLPATAGSLWDRVVSRVGSLTAGQPVPANLQKDLDGLADLLEQSATRKYQKGRTSLIQTYPGLNVPDESIQAPAAAPARSAAGPKVGERRLINGRLGEWDGKGWKPVQ